MDNINMEQPQEAAALIGRAITLDNEIKHKKKELEAVKAKLQALALAEMENKNLRYVRYSSILGNCEASYKTKFELDNYSKLAYALGDNLLLEDKVKRIQEVKYDVDSRFKKALIALARNDYAANDLDAVVQGLGITDLQTQKLVLKKLKGDYAKDRALLESVGCHGEMEEELDAIREELNRRMIDRYFASDLVDRDEIRKSVYIEDSLSITLTANNEG